MKDKIDSVHPLVKLALPLELTFIAYISSLEIKFLMTMFIVFLAYVLMDYSQRYTTLIYLLLLIVGYTITSMIAHISFSQWLYGLLNFTSISLSLVLLIVLIDPYDLDYVAVKLKLWSKYYVILRVTLIVFRALLRDVAEASGAVKAKHRGRLIGLAVLRYTAKMLVAALITVNSRVLELAETMYLYPPRPIIREYRLGTLFYLDIGLLIVLALLLTNSVMGA